MSQQVSYEEFNRQHSVSLQNHQPLRSRVMDSPMSSEVSRGTVHIEQSRAIAEAEGKIAVAKRFPRDTIQAYEDVGAACSRPSIASVAMYQYPRGGQTVSGPSIRLVEEVARCWGNIDYGTRELSRNGEYTEMEAYAWDMQTNTYSSQKFTVRHLREKSGGDVRLTSERDIYEITANMAARRLRARIMAVLPPDIIDHALAVCRSTINGSSDRPIEDKIKTMLVKLRRFGVSKHHIEELQGKPVNEFLPDDFADILGIYNSIKDGIGSASDYFGNTKEPTNSALDTARTNTQPKPELKL